MTQLAFIAVLSLLCNVPIFFMLRSVWASVPWTTPLVAVDVPDLTFDAIGLY